MTNVLERPSGNVDSKNIEYSFNNKDQIHSVLVNEAASATILENAAVSSLRLGYYDEAILCYERAVEIDMTFANCYLGLGNCYAFYRHEYQRAIEYFKMYLYFSAESPLGLYGLGYSYFYEKKYALAKQKLLRCIQLQPNNINAIRFYLCCFHREQLFSEMYEESVRLHQIHPDSFHVAYHAGLALGEMGYLDEAKNWLCTVRYNSNYEELVLSTLSYIYRKNKKFHLAVEAAEEILLKFPESLKAFGELSQSHAILGNIETAYGYCEKILNKDHTNELVRMRLGIYQLYLGDYEHGWANYEYRLAIYHTNDLELASKQFDRWNGENINGKSIVVIAEQGLGDIIQFSRYLSKIYELTGGASEVYFCAPSLITNLLKSSFNDIHFVNNIKKIDVEYYIPLLSLPLIAKTNETNIPMPINIKRTELFRDNGLSSSFKHKMNIGIVWAGNKINHTDYRRSIDLSVVMHCLLPANGVCYHALMYDIDAKDRQLLASRDDLFDHSSEICDLKDLARLALQCDLVISVDTLAAHIAASLNIKTWLLIALYPDWRWGKVGTSSAWYEAIKLYRQDNPYTWDSILEKLSSDLKVFVSIYMENDNE